MAQWYHFRHHKPKSVDFLSFLFPRKENPLDTKAGVLDHKPLAAFDTIQCHASSVLGDILAGIDIFYLTDLCMKVEECPFQPFANAITNDVPFENMAI